MTALTEPIVFEKDDRFYFVGPVSPAKPSVQDIEEFAFGQDIVKSLKDQAPNEHIAWFGGHYVEADTPNGNGHMWRGSEIAVKSLTPMFMPVTVMHDPRTAVGLIADAKLFTPEKDNVQRSKIETALALWKHRFPQAVEEAMHNYASGSLMQSMECMAPDYECGECGRVFQKLPDGAEQDQWCSHLKGENGEPGARILRNVVFTGTGLIFGSRGARGADPNAYLDSFQEEVAQFHQGVKTDARRTKRSKPKMDEITLAKSEYDRLVKERDDAVERNKALEADKTAADEAKRTAEREAEEAEAAKVKAEEETADLKKKVDEHEERARQEQLRDERFEALGKGFIAKLGEKTQARLKTQAATMSDDDWSARLDEVEEMVGVKRDAEGEGDDGSGDGKGGEEFTAAQIAAHKGGGGNGNGGAKAQSPAARRSVISALTRPSK